MLDHIHIENFRLFKMLDIPKIGQVNLITGKNNCGKTTLLEALRLYGNRSAPHHMESTFLSLLKGRGDLGSEPHLGFDSIYFNGNFTSAAEINYSLKIFYGGLRKSQVKTETIDIDIAYRLLQPNEPIQDRSFFLPASFNLPNANLWKTIELTEKEDQVAEVLRIIEPEIVRVSLDLADNTAKVRLKSSPKPVPLKNFGEGMNRLLAIALGLVSAENDILLIDEIDLGLHYTVQTLLWEIVFQTAKKLNVQVFATTHSSDCVRSFSDIANKPEYAGMGNYLRLQKSKSDEGIIVVDYEMEELETALELNLETR